LAAINALITTRPTHRQHEGPLNAKTVVVVTVIVVVAEEYLYGAIKTEVTMRLGHT